MRNWFASLTTFRRLVISVVVPAFALLCLWPVQRQSTRQVQIGAISMTEESYVYIREWRWFWLAYGVGVVVFLSWLWLWGSPQKTGDQP